MASGVDGLIKAVMRAFGVPNNPIEIIDRLLEDKGVSREELIAMGFQIRDLALDYHQRLAQIEALLVLLCQQNGISKLQQLELKQNGHENTGHADDADDADELGSRDRRSVGE